MFKKPYKKPAKIYAGIGNRDTPLAFLALISEISKRLQKHSYCLRSGAAEGADMAFMNGTMNAEIYVPWHNYNGFPMRHQIPREAERLAAQYNPHWEKTNVSKGVKAMHARNMMIITGPHLEDPVDFVVCYTRDGCDCHATRSPQTGGTGSAISYADAQQIPIINLANANSPEYLTMFSGVDFMDMVLPAQNTGF